MGGAEEQCVERREMGDSEFDSFFDDAPPPAADTGGEAAEAFGDSFTDAPPSEPAADMGGMGDMGGMDMSAGMADMSSAFVTTANLSDSGPLAEWRTANRAKMEERAAASKAELDKILAQAET